MRQLILSSLEKADDAVEVVERKGFGRPDTICDALAEALTRSLCREYRQRLGASAEAGDDGQVGRGNRVNGLITPCRAMSLEAAAGKNPVTHVGKVYNVIARDIAEALVATVPEIARAQCLMVSRIGAPVSQPAMMQIELATRNGAPANALRTRVEEVAADRLASIPGLVDAFVAGTIELF
jgi:S-adenosylmethionine synthetase